VDRDHAPALPCPFCGGDRLAAILKEDGTSGVVRCKACGAAGPIVHAQQVEEGEVPTEERLWASTEAAILAWSFRAGMSAPGARDLH
jgi:hypothetical protein